MRMNTRPIVAVAAVMVLLASCTTVPDDGTPEPAPRPLASPAQPGDGARTAAITGAVFSARCAWSHTLTDDPIVLPGLPGQAHSHDFYGNAATDAYSTPASLVAAATTTCDQPGDTASYWSPSLIVRGVVAKPFGTDVYYRDGGISNPALLLAYPVGLVMIAGNSGATVEQDLRIVQWGCTGEPSATLGTTKPHPCGDKATRVKIEFPNCWDGINLDSPDHKSHMAYPPNFRGDCPASHPVNLPAFDLGVRWRATELAGAPMRRLRLASGSILTWHADFVNSWQQPDLERLVNDCLRASIKCGTIADVP